MKLNAMALTGGMGSGKSTVMGIFSQLGFSCVDADKLVASIFFEEHKYFHSIAQELDDWLKTDFRNQKYIDKNILRSLLEGQQNGFQKHLKIMTPYVRKEIIDFVEKNPWPVIEAALIIESGMADQFHCITVIDTSRQTQIQRVKRRNPNLSLNTINAMINSQTSQKERLWYANYVIENNMEENMGALITQTKEVAKAYMISQNVYEI